MGGTAAGDGTLSLQGETGPTGPQGVSEAPAPGRPGTNRTGRPAAQGGIRQAHEEPQGPGGPGGEQGRDQSTGREASTDRTAVTGRQEAHRAFWPRGRSGPTGPRAQVPPAHRAERGFKDETRRSRPRDKPRGPQPEQRPTAHGDRLGPQRATSYQ